MNSRATISHAKVGGSEYGRESVLTLTLDVRLPSPVEVRTLHEWAGSELDWQTRQQIAKAQQHRANGKPAKLTKAQKSAQAQAHDQGIECSVAACETCYPDGAAQDLVCLAHRLPSNECQDCDDEAAIFLEEEDVKLLASKYESYVQERTSLNHEALQAAKEAAMFLLLIKKPVYVSISPAQRSFADLLQLPAPAP